MLFPIFHILGRTATHLNRPVKVASRWVCGPILVSRFYAFFKCSTLRLNYFYNYMSKRMHVANYMCVCVCLMNE